MFTSAAHFSVSAIMALNSAKSGLRMGLSKMLSPSLMTISFAPEARESASRMAFGSTTCPFEEIAVTSVRYCDMSIHPFGKKFLQ